MKRGVWLKAIKESADPERSRHYFDLLSAKTSELENYTPDEARVVAAVFSGSRALSNLLLLKPDWLAFIKPNVLQFPRRKQGLAREVEKWLQSQLKAKDFEKALSKLRVFNQSQMLRIGARDLVAPGNAIEIAREISDVADVCLDAAWRICRAKLEEKFGEPWHQDSRGEWRRTAGCLIGLGKLGGQELNYSSDVDVIFVYEEEGTVFKGSEGPRVKAGRTSHRLESLKRNRQNTNETSQPGVTFRGARLTNHQFFERLAELFVAELTRLTPEGTLYRIDLRLRPEGDVGPLTRSLAGYENYYAQWGQTWERMMLMKARWVAGDESLSAEFLEMVQPFRYPRAINENVLKEVAAMKARIESEVVKEGELERNVKLGRGGIREIEFIAQVSQLLHAGRQPFLQGSQTVPCLDKLVQYEWLQPEDARSLSGAYRFLRDVEHRLQMEDNRQTHTIPSEPSSRERLGRLMGLSGAKEFEAVYQQHTNQVRKLFNQILKVETPQTRATIAFPTEFKNAEEQWKPLLEEYHFRDISKAFRVLREFVEGPGYVHVSPRTQELAYHLLPRLFQMSKAGLKVQRSKSVDNRQVLSRLSDPDRVVTRLDNFIAAYGARATLFELWNSNPSLFELLVLLFDRSEFLAEMAIRTPDLVDELVLSGRLGRRKTAEETLRDLRHGLGDKDQARWLRRYHQAELMRIGLRDILGWGTTDQYLSELSALADACLRYALEVVLARNKLKRAPFAIIGLGKLGGEEIDYGSDLDIVFVGPSTEKILSKSGRLAIEVMELLSARTEDGQVFLTDARLRPDGEKGLLVNTLDAYEKYYRQRSQLWEVQSLTRVRAIAGDHAVGARFQQLAAKLTNFAQPSLPLAAFSKDWKQVIHRMRLRIENERTPRGKDSLAIKTGKGGLMDAEFIAQALSLENGWQEANTLKALERGNTGGKLPRGQELIESYLRLRRIEGVLRRWSYEGETLLPDDPAAYYRVSVRCGFEQPEDFHQMIADSRKTIREVYLLVMNVQ